MGNPETRDIFDDFKDSEIFSEGAGDAKIDFEQQNKRVMPRIAK